MKLRDYALGVALAVLIMGSVLLLPAVAGAAADAKPESAEAGAKKVSPYAVANRQRLAAAGEGEHSTKRPPGQASLQAKPVNAKRH